MSEAALQRLRDWGAQTTIVLGSGLSCLTDSCAAEQRIAYAEFEELPQPTVPGHAGEFVLGELAGERLIYARGRVHLYEGHSPAAVTAGIRLLARCGVRQVFLTNAAGAVNPAFHPGSWMTISDHLNLTGANPLVGSAKFVDLSNAYSRHWQSRFSSAAERLGMRLNSGVYAGVVGPNYETPAEVRMLGGLGADAIGMSTVLETIQARALGLEVAGFSCLTNWAAGIGALPLSHEEVLAAGKGAAADFRRLLTAALER